MEELTALSKLSMLFGAFLALFASVDSLVYGCRAYVILFCNLRNGLAAFIKSFHCFLLLWCKCRLLRGMHTSFDLCSMGSLDTDKVRVRLILFFKPDGTAASIAALVGL